MGVAGKILRYLAFVWVFILVVGTFFLYADFNTNTGFLLIKNWAVNTGWYLPFFYCHVFASSLILLVGFFQFAKQVYRRKTLHRVLGKIYVFGVLVFAAPGAFGMIFFINRGTGVFASFMLQNTLWVLTTALAWHYAVKNQIDQHVCMMRRSYGLAFAAVTLRFYIWLFTVLGNGVNFENNYLIIAFLSWVPNLILVELINKADKGKVL